MPNTTPGLIVHSLEIGKALADHNRAVLHARGMCMYPLVRPGDLLHLQDRRVGQVAVGDIVVCRRAERLVCHRIVAKGVQDGRPYIVTRSDRNKGDNDPLTFDEDLLGIVTCIERNGEAVNATGAEAKGTARFFLDLRRALLEMYYFWRKPLLDLVSFVQHTAGYRTGARLFLSASRHPARYEVRVWKESWRKLGLYMPLKPEDFDIQGPARQKGGPGDRWTLTLHLDDGNRPAAQASFQSDPDSWSLDNLQVRFRYRGMDLETDLMNKAEEIFRRNGIKNFNRKRFPLE